MRKLLIITSIVFLALIFSFFIVKFCSIQKEETKKPHDAISSNIKKIEEETQSCLDEGFAMPECCNDAMDKYNTEIEKTLKNLEKILSQSQYEKLTISQNKWTEFINSNNELHENTLKTCRASIPVLISTCSEMRIVKNRLEDLNSIYETYKEFKEDCYDY